MDIGRLFLDKDDNRTRLMYVWGHSYELDGFMAADESKNWQYMERFCQQMHDSPQIHCATTIEIVDYLNALKTLRFSPGKPAVENTSEITVWLNLRGTTVAVPPGENVDLSTSTPASPCLRKPFTKANLQSNFEAE